MSMLVPSVANDGRESTSLLQIDDYMLCDTKLKLDGLRLDDASDDDEDLFMRLNPLYEPDIEFRPTEYKISTMTVIAGILSRMDLELIYHKIVCDDDIPGILNIRFRDFPPKGLYSRKRVARKNSKMRKVFLNQITFDVLPSMGRRVSVKLFKDGKMQLAGCKSEAEAHLTIQVLLGKLERIRECEEDGEVSLKMTDEKHESAIAESHRLDDEEWRDFLHTIKTIKTPAKIAATLPEFVLPYTRRAVESSKPLETIPSEIVMINSDFDAGLPIDKVLLKHILQHNYGLFCLPLSSCYPALNSKRISSASCTYGCTSGSEESRQCAIQTKRKRRKNGCCMVSILIFQQGKIIMTGARSVLQLDDTYKFITDVFRKDYDLFRTSVFP